jgi:hypothetical protein
VWFRSLVSSSSILNRSLLGGVKSILRGITTQWTSSQLAINEHGSIILGKPKLDFSRNIFRFRHHKNPFTSKTSSHASLLFPFNPPHSFALILLDTKGILTLSIKTFLLNKEGNLQDAHRDSSSRGKTKKTVSRYFSTQTASLGTLMTWFIYVYGKSVWCGANTAFVLD